MAPVLELGSILNETLGAIVIGGFVNSILYGILVLQTYIFLLQMRKDKLLLRLSVWTLFIMNTLHLICIIHALYFYTVTNFADFSVLLSIIPWSGPMVILLTTTTAVLVQAWFIFRVWKLSDGNTLLVASLIIGCVIVLGWTDFTGVATALSVKLFQLSTFIGFANVGWLFFFALGTNIVEDLVIAIALCFYIHRMRSHILRYVSFHVLIPPILAESILRSSSVVNILMVYMVNTGLLTSLLCVAIVITRACWPDTFIFFGLSLPLSNLYSNALLGSLNARDWFQNSFQKAAQAITIRLANSSEGSEVATPSLPTTTAAVPQLSGSCGSESA
ncbi:uncharacterized protein PHACADRAFT_211768 [Phanerochaete carnosa HHB-10118-sp]|uniref:DUF6534 domain-containing protein n=1 Tax=Phanerochaete carnosa (strain HHB-10118-sp) TaxID=650164 RepID=K5W0W3_PHACS|nr:uncharacterized protein PHACADRAFT_211768 [Phanerochaete carnosa HHB-10118-sp]EKM52519.1 hypothetical protein PHACADRAFT_211768 [Phanerochaete carnosa HHB-10118-sp]